MRQPGCIQLKSLCIQNLHVEAHSPDEKQLLDEFMNDAKEVIANTLVEIFFFILHFIDQNGWLLEETAKAVNDVNLRFREERHTLKQQVSLNPLLDLS